MSPATRHGNLRLGWVVLALLLPALPALAQSKARPAISVGSFSSTKSCKIYETLWATRYAWGTELVRDCVNNFEGIRGTMQSALAASGKVIVGSGKGGYKLTGHLSDIGAETSEVTTDGYSLQQGKAVVSMDVQLHDASGRIVYGGVITKRSEDYHQLQQSIALAAARRIVFKLVPLQVTAVNGNHISFNYGAPFLELGGDIQITRSDGSSARASVVSSTNDSAVATIDIGSNGSGVYPGNAATFIEADDPAANARRYERVDLPR